MRLRIATCRPLPEPDPDQELLLAALARRGVRARTAAWNDPGEDWIEPVATVIRSTWDYIHDLPGFLAWSARVAARAPLWNPLQVVRGNVHKGYLLDLAARGVAIVPTRLAKRGERSDLGEVVREEGWKRVVIKPAVGCSSHGAAVFAADALDDARRHLDLWLGRGDVLLQPYLAAVEDHGERSLVWIDGAFTHAIRKSPRLAGQREHVSAAVPIAGDERELAARALAPLVGNLLYARIDVARDDRGVPCVMELELVEPSLFLRQSPDALERLADGLARRLREG